MRNMKYSNCGAYNAKSVKQYENDKCCNVVVNCNGGGSDSGNGSGGGGGNSDCNFCWTPEDINAAITNAIKAQVDCSYVSSLYSGPYSALVATSTILGDNCEKYSLQDLVNYIEANIDCGGSGSGGGMSGDLTCSGLEALFTPSIASPGSNALLYGAGCEAYTLAQVIQGIINDSSANTILNQFVESIINGGSVVNIINDTVDCDFVDALYPASSDALTGSELFKADGCKSFTLDDIAVYIDSVGSGGGGGGGTVDCATVDALTPLSTAALTGSEEIKINGCAAHTLDQIAKYIAEGISTDVTEVTEVIGDTVDCAFVNALYPLSTDPIMMSDAVHLGSCRSATIEDLAALIVSTVEITEVDCSVLTGFTTAPAAVDDLVLGGDCKQYAVTQLVSSTISAPIAMVLA